MTALAPLAARLLRAAAALLLVAGLSGCVHKVRDTGYLADYETFNAVHRDGMHLRVANFEDFTADDAHVASVVQARLGGGEAEIDREVEQPTLFIVPKPEWMAGKRLSAEEEDAVLFTIRERLYRYLLRQYSHPVRVRYAYDPLEKTLEGYRVVTIECAVTDFREGVAFTRYFIGYGVGMVEIQFEGRIYEGADQELLLGEFAIREGHGGYPNGFINTRVLEPAYCAQYAVEEALMEFTAYLRKFIPGVRSRTAPPVEHIDRTSPSPYLMVRGDQFRDYIE